MDNGYSLSDVAAVAGENGFGGNNALLILVLFAMIFGWGGNGWGNNGALDSAIAAQGGYVTNSQMNNALQFESLQQGNRDITAAVSQGKYDTLGAISAAEQRLTANQASILALENSIAERQNTCCTEILRGVDGVNFNAAMNTAAINTNVSEQIQKVLDVITGNRMADMQEQINQLQLAQAMNGVVRYPDGFVYSAGSNPFCSCGCGSTNI